MTVRHAYPRTARHGITVVLTVSAAMLGLLGCGIRSTDIPVDAGPAPTRASCSPPERTEDDTTEVFLVCGSRVEPVARAVRVPTHEVDDRVAVASALLSELQTAPERVERAVGFSSEVPSHLTVSGPVGDDSEHVLRLSEDLKKLSAVALVQIVCTFAHTEPTGDGVFVLLGGPADEENAENEAPQKYTCSAALRHSPETARTASSSP